MTATFGVVDLCSQVLLARCDMSASPRSPVQVRRRSGARRLPRLPTSPTEDHYLLVILAKDTLNISGLPLSAALNYNHKIWALVELEDVYQTDFISASPQSRGRGSNSINSSKVLFILRYSV